MAAASITVDGTDEELRSLANWLRDEADLRGRVQVASAPIQEGHLGATLDAIVVILTSATAGTLITSVKDWLIAKSADRKVTLKLRSGDREVELTCGSASEVDALMAGTREFFQEGS